MLRQSLPFWQQAVQYGLSHWGCNLFLKAGLSVCDCEGGQKIISLRTAKGKACSSAESAEASREAAEGLIKDEESVCGKRLTILYRAGKKGGREH